MACECVECSEYGGPNTKVMMFRFFVAGMQILIALVGMIKERSWKSLAAFFGAFALFATVPRTLICCRCEGYGNKCYSLYMGKITSMYLPKSEGKEMDVKWGAGLELLSLATIANAPAIGLRKNKKLLALYLLFSNLTVAMQFFHSCRHCAQNATDWRKDCPSAKTARLFFGGGREVAL
jgi:hypothetical protein